MIKLPSRMRRIHIGVYEKQVLIANPFDCLRGHVQVLKGNVHTFNWILHLYFETCNVRIGFPDNYMQLFLPLGIHGMIRIYLPPSLGLVSFCKISSALWGSTSELNCEQCNLRWCSPSEQVGSVGVNIDCIQDASSWFKVIWKFIHVDGSEIQRTTRGWKVIELFWTSLYTS